MSGLLPNELWDYDLFDALRGLSVAVSCPHLDCLRDIVIPGVGSCRPIRSARAGIVLALKALGLAPGASVGVPLYCCPAVFKAVKAAGHSARFIDVDPATCCLSPADLAAKRSQADAIIAVHMFGNVCDVRALREAAPGIPIIEDCAQSLGSRLDGRAAGAFGDSSVFSFRSGKYLSVGEGGAIYCSERQLELRLSELIAELPVPGRAEDCVHVANTYLRSLLRTKPLWGLVGARLWHAYSTNVSYTSQSRLVLTRIFGTDRDMAVRRLPRLSSWIERQRSNADYYSRNLKLDPGMLCQETPGTYFNRLQYPLLLPTSEQCDRLAAWLRKNQISTARPYRDIAAIAATHYGYTGDCPNAERVARTVLVIPCHHALEAADVERIATCVNRAWSKIGSRPFVPAETDIVDRRAPETDGVRV